MFIQGLMLYLKIFFKNRWLSLFYIFTLLGIIVFTLITLSINPLVNFIILLNNLYYFSCLFCITTFMFFIYAKRIGINEIIDSIYQKSNGFQIISFVAMLGLFFVMNIVILGSLYISSYTNGQLSLCTTIISNYYIMNVFLPLFVSFTITYILSCLENYRLSALLLVGSFILSSPLTKFLEFRFPLILGLDRIIHYIQLPFSYFVQNMDYGIDCLYGFQNEMYKLSITLFWSLVAIASILRYKKFLKVILVVIITFSFITIYVPQSVGRVDKKSFGTYYDYNYYDVSSGKANYFLEEPINYYISDYSLQIKINRQLSVSGYVIIESGELKSEYDLTLYHGYKVKDIEGENLSDFKISGDTIHLKFKKQTKKEKINISYSGYNQNLYSNYQAAMLPGYFPWYPMAGIKQVYITINQLQTGNQGYNPYNKIPKANFEVIIDEVHFPYVINLPKKSEKSYAGISDGLTLIGGQISVLKDSQFMNYLPLEELLSSQDEDQRIKRIIEIKRDIKNIFDYNAKFLDKKIIICSTLLSFSNQYSGYSEFNNYIISPGNLLNKIDIMEYYVNKSHINPLLKSAIDSCNLKNINSIKEYLNEVLMVINEGIQISKDRDDKKSYQSGLLLKKSIEEYVGKYGAEAYLKGLGKKLFDEEKVYENFY